MSIQDANFMGASLKQASDDFKLLPLPVLQQYMSNPTAVSADGVTYGLLAGAELARRKRLQDSTMASQQPDPTRIPTIAESLVSGAPMGQPGVPVEKSGIAAFAQQQPQQQPQQPQEITLNQPKQAAPIAIAAPYASPKTPLQQQARYAPAAPAAPAAPVRRMAQGGIVAFQEGGMSRPERDAGRVAELDFEEALLQDAALDPNLKDPATREALMQAMRADAAAGKKFSYKPQAAPTSTGLSSLRQMLIQQAPELMQQAGINRTFSQANADAARAKAEAERSAITEPRMAEIRRLQEEAQGIGSRRDEGALGRALMEAGFRGLQASSRPGSAASALGIAGMAGVGSYEKEQMGIIDRALRLNQTKIALETDLMKQGLDRLTAGNLAEKEARRVVDDEDKENRNAAKNMFDILKGGATVEADADRENRLRTAEVRREQELQARLARGNNPRLTDAERAHSRRAAGYIRQGFSTEVADEMAQREVDQIKMLPTEANLSKAAQEELARVKILDDQWRRAKTPEEKAKREEELLKIIQARQPTRPGATPAAPAGSASPVAGGAQKTIDFSAIKQ